MKTNSKTVKAAQKNKANNTKNTKNTKKATKSIKSTAKPAAKSSAKKTIIENIITSVKKRAARKSRKSKFKSANSDLFYNFLYCGANLGGREHIKVRPETLGFALANPGLVPRLKPNQSRPSYAKEEMISSDNAEHTEFLLINSSGNSEETINSRFTPGRGTIASLVIKNDLKNLKKRVCRGNVNEREEKSFVSSFTPLYWAVKYRRMEAAEILLAAGANISIVINDLEECCGTALDLASIRNDQKMEELIRGYLNKEEVDQATSYRAIRSKLRGKSTPGFSFRYTAKAN